MKKLMWVGDAGCPSGFAVATHKILDTLRFHFDVTVLGINYLGDPNPYTYDLYPAFGGGDVFGINRLHFMCNLVQPDVIVIQQDGWNIPSYIRMLRIKKANGEYHYPEHAKIPVIAAVAVDGQNFRGEWLDGVAKAIFWTQFALDEARKGGYAGPAEVITLGVDLDDYYPVAKDEALAGMQLSQLVDKFIVGNVNRNQPRKRWDLTIRYFANWVHAYKISDALLFLHAAPTGESAVDVRQLCQYYGVQHMLAMREPAPFIGESIETMRNTYCACDIMISTTQGEGFGLTTLEAMACGRPSIVPEWSGLGDWAPRGAWMVPCTSTVVNPVANTNVIGGVPDEKQFIQAMQRLYTDKPGRLNNSMAAFECANLLKFRWRTIGEQWVGAVHSIVEETIHAAH